MKVLVIGWYNHGNVGDQLFIDAFQHIFPEIEFSFVDSVKENDLNDKDAIFFGGGSFLDGQPAFTENVMHLIANKKVFYIGVGADTDIHSWHKFLLRKAKFIACRSREFDNIKTINSNIEYYPDLVYALYNKTTSNILPSNKKSVLILSNAIISSKWDDVSWKHNAWEYFKSEFSQFIEELTNQKYKIDFFPMCKNSKTDDYFSSIEIINKTHNHSKYTILNQEFNFEKLIGIFSSYNLVISQRYHGLILADLLEIPCLNIHHHNKLKNFNSKFTENISYYNISKDLLFQKFNDLLYLKNIQLQNNISIKSDIFGDLKDKVINLIQKE